MLFLWQHRSNSLRQCRVVLQLQTYLCTTKNEYFVCIAISWVNKVDKKKITLKRGKKEENRKNLSLFQFCFQVQKRTLLRKNNTIQNDIENNIPTARKFTCAEPSFIVNAKIKGIQAYLHKTNNNNNNLTYEWNLWNDLNYV